ncbi:hypothetical protein ACFXHA_44325 [Nocardia sp. NPDC059240]|uniref:hypothetical protein n=1 Tax=Nocardia sp. NPDC059240 TaxID=3346786 RepID=UPI00367A0FA6
MGFGGGSADKDLDALDRILADAHEVRVREMPGDSVPLLVERDRVAVQALREALRIADMPGFVCRCQGDVALEFLGRAGTRLATVTLHHGYSVRWTGWREDALLADGMRTLEWLAVRGVSEPLREYRETEQARVESARIDRLWESDIPAPLTPYLELFRDTSRTGRDLTATQIREMREMLLAAHPDPVDRVLRLCTWFGSGTGEYSGYPLHEEIPQRFLDLETPADFARAVEIADDRPTAGAVRYLLSDETEDHLTPLLSALSPAACSKILLHTHDPDHRQWLQHKMTDLR